MPKENTHNDIRLLKQSDFYEIAKSLGSYSYSRAI